MGGGDKIRRGSLRDDVPLGTSYALDTWLPGHWGHLGSDGSAMALLANPLDQPLYTASTTFECSTVCSLRMFIITSVQSNLSYLFWWNKIDLFSQSHQRAECYQESQSKQFYIRLIISADMQISSSCVQTIPSDQNGALLLGWILTLIFPIGIFFF